MNLSNQHVLVVGAGVAGLSAAIHAATYAGASGSHVTLVSEGTELERGGNTQLAQGGIAAAIGPGDSPDLHAADTVAAGAGLVDPKAAQLLAVDGASAVSQLIAQGFAVDRTASGLPALGMEGAHGVARIVHAGEDRSGSALHAFLREQTLALVREGRIELLTLRTTVGLVVEHDEVVGVDLRDPSGTITRHSATAVIIATGGYAGLFPRSTNASGARGDGLLLAARAGALLADLEFVQFHPTVLHGTGSLISEAVRGAGAVLRDAAGHRFMQDAHPLAELAPRDVVSREMHRVMRERGSVVGGGAVSEVAGEAAVWIDATSIEHESGPGTLARRFPTITAAVHAQGYDWAREPVPVSPAAHYSMGGIITDLDGCTNVPGLFAAGEATATGVHGANRLASNSLLEGLVFGRRAGLAAASYRPGSGVDFAPASLLGSSFDKTLLEATLLTPTRSITLAATHADASAGDRTPGGRVTGSATSRATSRATGPAIDRAIDHGLGIVRSADDLRDAARVFASAPHDPSAQLASLIAAAASARTESRGAHQRSDFVQTDPSQAKRRVVRAVAARSTPLPLGGQTHGPATDHTTTTNCTITIISPAAKPTASPVTAPAAAPTATLA